MSNIEKIDRNFAIKDVKEEGIRFYDPCEEPFQIFGLLNPAQGDFRRMPAEVAGAVSEGVLKLHTNTAGGRIRFRSNTKRIVIKYRLPSVNRMLHMPITGSSSFDLYNNREYDKCMLPSKRISSEPLDPQEYLFSERDLITACERDLELNFPLYNDVTEIYVGVEESASVLPAQNQYVNNKEPVVFYGSSITQGGCASHPGNSYQAILSRRLNMNYVNLGFSGNCKAEDAMADYIVSLPMKALVYDYDHNAPNPAFLRETHQRFFHRVRAARPDLPILMISKADLGHPYVGEKVLEAAQRREIIRRTYEEAVAAGDRNVWFLDGGEFYKEVGRSFCTVDSTHPNDIGFLCMANAMEPVLREVLKK